MPAQETTSARGKTGQAEMKSAGLADPGEFKSGRAGTASPETVCLRGRVAAGNGKSSFHVERHAELIREALGASMVRGSLNIILKHPVMLKNGTARVTCYGNEKPHFYWPGRLNGTEVWLYRWRSAPLHVVELLATVRLRTHLNLSDGDEVEVEARARDIGRISGLGRLTWMLLWSGRKNGTYANQRYYFPAQRWGKKFGATQLGTNKRLRDLVAALFRLTFKKIAGLGRPGGKRRKDGYS
jgi:CTP-dependent riboflavin kinase